MRIATSCAECEGGHTLVCGTCDGAGINMIAEGGAHACGVCGGSGHVRCRCDSSPDEPSFWRSWKSEGEAQAAT